MKLDKQHPDGTLTFGAIPYGKEAFTARVGELALYANKDLTGQWWEAWWRRVGTVVWHRLDSTFPTCDDALTAAYVVARLSQ